MTGGSSAGFGQGEEGGTLLGGDIYIETGIRRVRERCKDRGRKSVLGNSKRKALRWEGAWHR